MCVCVFAHIKSNRKGTIIKGKRKGLCLILLCIELSRKSIQKYSLYGAKKFDLMVTCKWHVIILRQALEELFYCITVHFFII